MTFTAGVYYGEVLRMNNYTLRFWMTTNSTDPDNHNIAFERIKYFVYQELDSTIFINNQQQEQCQLYANAGLKITTMPGDPVDQLVGIMLYHKLTAILEDRMIIDETELSSLLGDSMGYLHSGNETTSIDHEPDWWHTPDLIHCDFTLLTNNKIVTMHQSNTWRDVGLSWPDATDGDHIVESGNTVVFADFKRSDDTE
jgi:hypothetical protein